MSDNEDKRGSRGEQGFTKLGDLTGALPFKSPKATRHETQIMRAAVEIEQTPLDIDRDLSYWPRGIVQCALPHSNPGNVPAYARSSGPFFLIVQPGFHKDLETGALKSLGFPYGSYPRLVCSYIAREVQRTKNRRISLGDSLSAFMRELGLVPTGGRWGTITALRRQIIALLNARIQFGYDGQATTAAGETLSGEMGGNEIFARRHELWWSDTRARPENVVVLPRSASPIDPDQGSLFENYITLGEGLFEEMLKAFPCDMRILRALKQSSLALDLYAWATSKVYGMKSKTPISWKAMHAQFGEGYQSQKRFREKALQHLRVINVLYPEFKFTLERGRLIIWPSNPSVLPLPKR